jgi:translation initiation factor 2 alpha subunit (eIF-2alpha)
MNEYISWNDSSR